MHRLRQDYARRGDRRSAGVLAAFVLAGLTACTGGPVSDSLTPEVPQPDVTAPAAVPQPAVTAPVAADPTAPAVTAPALGTPPPTAEPSSPTGSAPEWEAIFNDEFDGPAGTAPSQWHPLAGWNGASLDGQGRLQVDRLAQLRSVSGWSLPAGTRVRTTVSLVMPDTGSNYAAFWVQHPSPADPREIDVIESYGPSKPAGAQVGSHICYDDSPETASNACAATGRGPELWPVADAFPKGAGPWDISWEYAAEFTIGGDTVRFSAADGTGSELYSVTTLPDPRRVPSNTIPLHLRLSNKDVVPRYAVSGGQQHSMFVDWVRVEVDYP